MAVVFGPGTLAEFPESRVGTILQIRASLKLMGPGLVSSWLLVLAALGLIGCGSPESRSGAEPLRVAAAADLQTVLPELVEAFVRNNRSARPELMFGASGQLALQLRQGAPVDLFLSADRHFVDDLVSQGVLVARSARDYIQGSLCLVVHASARSSVREITDLSDPAVSRIAIANPETAPYGRAAKEALVAADLWDRLESRIVFAENVRQALQFVQSGNAEAGLVGCALARTTDLAQFEVDPDLYDPIVQRLGWVRGSRHAEAAQAFSDFLLGAEAQKILQDHGFRPCTGPPSGNTRGMR